MSQNSKKFGSKVFKKSSPNGKITVYLGKRDFVDHGTHVDLIDGVVLVDPDYLKDRKVFGHVLAAFRYGKEECDVLGATFRKTLYQSSSQIYPLYDDSETAKRPLTRLQERLVKKLGSNAFPFFYSLPSHCPASVTLQPAPGDTGKPCGIDYEMKAYVGDMVEDLPNKRNSVTLAIRKVTYAPSNYGDQPSVEVSKVFMMSQNKLHLECSLDKELYHHGERISVNVHIQNNSNRTVKKTKVSVRQFTDICHNVSRAQYKCTVAEKESVEGFPVGSGSTLSKVYHLEPSLSNNMDKYGLALDGQLKHEDTNLASTTFNPTQQKENLEGIIVHYKVKVKLCLGHLAGELTAELPFTLMHPKPHEDLDQFGQNPHQNKNREAANLASRETPDIDLIELETEFDNNEDIIFENFARLRLKGEEVEE